MAAALREMGLEGDMQTVEIDAKVGGRFLISDVRNGVETRHWANIVSFSGRTGSNLRGSRIRPKKRIRRS